MKQPKTREELCKETGNDQARTTESAFNDGWYSCKKNLFPSNGCEVVVEERKEQLFKHNRFIAEDAIYNSKNQLAEAAMKLLLNRPDDTTVKDASAPEGWDKMIWERMMLKPYHERVKIAGALLIAEVDRIMFE